MSGNGKSQPLRVLWEAQGSDYVSTLAWSPDATRVAVGHADGTLAVHDALDGHRIWCHDAHGLGVASLGWSPEARILASGGLDNSAALWAPDEGTELRRLKAGRGWVQNLTWSERGILGTTAGRELRLWDAHGDELYAFEPASSTLTGLSWQGEDRLMTSSYGGIEVWRTDAAKPVRIYEWKGSLLKLAVSPDSRTLAASTQENAIHLWDAESADDFQMSGYPAKVMAMGWRHDSRYFATGAGESLVIWDFAGAGPQGTEPLTVTAHTARINTIAFSHADARLASGGDDGILAVYDTSSQRRVASQREDVAVSVLAWSPDDRAILVGHASGRLGLFASPGAQGT
jgi:WD40 repeat protein